MIDITCMGFCWVLLVIIIIIHHLQNNLYDHIYLLLSWVEILSPKILHSCSIIIYTMQCI